MRTNLAEELEIGKKITISTGRSYDVPFFIGTVKKITPTQVTLTNGEVYMLRTGIERGSASWGYGVHRIAEDWKTGNLVPVEFAEKENREWQEIKEKMKLVRQLEKIEFGKISDEDFEIVKSVLEKYFPKE